MAMFAKVDTASSGALTLATGVVGRRYRVLAYSLVAAGTVTITWKSGSNLLTGAMSMVVGVPHTAPVGGNSLDGVPLMVCNAGEDLVLTLGGAVQVSGWVVYDVVT